jgi:hypothetical protein
MRPIVRWSSVHRLFVKAQTRVGFASNSTQPRGSLGGSAVRLSSSELRILNSPKLDFRVRVLVNLERIKRPSDQDI